MDSLSEQSFKRNIAYKLRVGEILDGKQIIDGERLKFLEIDGKQVVRINLIANITDKYVQDGEKKFASVTLDDASGQIKVKTFGDDVKMFENFNQGDTVLIIGLIRSWNNELYLTPEIIKKRDPSYLLVRKLEIETDRPKAPNREQLTELKDKIIDMVKKAESDGGLETETLILKLKEHPDVINQEIKKLLEEGLIYEPRPGKTRWLG